MSRKQYNRHVGGGVDGAALCGAMQVDLFETKEQPATCPRCIRRRDNPDWNKRCRSCGKKLEGRVTDDPAYPDMHANCARLLRQIARDSQA